MWAGGGLLPVWTNFNLGLHHRSPRIESCQKQKTSGGREYFKSSTTGARSTFLMTISYYSTTEPHLSPCLAILFLKPSFSEKRCFFMLFFTNTDKNSKRNNVYMTIFYYSTTAPHLPPCLAILFLKPCFSEKRCFFMQYFTNTDKNSKRNNV